MLADRSTTDGTSVAVTPVGTLFRPSLTGPAKLPSALTWMLAKAFVCEFACNSNGADGDVGGLVVREKEFRTMLSGFCWLLAWLFAPFDDGLDLGDMRTTTSTKTVTVLTTVPEIPRTVNWVRPPVAASATCTGKEPVAKAATVPGVAWKLGGRFGKSIDTVPAKPKVGTTVTESGMVTPGMTGNGLVLVEDGITIKKKVELVVTSTKTVAVLTTVPEVPRTVNWVRPPRAVSCTCTRKTKKVPAATTGVTWKPGGRFGKSMDTVPAKPKVGTTTTESGMVPPGLTGIGLVLVENGIRLKEKVELVVTSTKTKTVAVLTTVPEVPRTVNWVRPPGTVAATCTGKEPVSPAGTVAGVA